MRSNSYPGHNYSMRADPHVVFNHYWIFDKRAIHIYRVGIMSRSGNGNVRCDHCPATNADTGIAPYMQKRRDRNVIIDKYILRCLNNSRLPDYDVPSAMPERRPKRSIVR